MSKRLMSLFTVVMMLAVFGSAHAAQIIAVSPAEQTGIIAVAPAPANGFIMSDGRICNPRWGC